jgi:hypothetical protein
MLLKEMQEYADGVNVDRLVAFCCISCIYENTAIK